MDSQVMSSQQIKDFIFSNQNDNAEEMIRVNPDEVKKDRYLLWDAIWRKPTYSLVRALIDADPEQAKENKIDNEYPLHKAIKEDHPSDIILLILDAYPEAAKVKDSDGWYPIHKAVETKCSLEVITKLDGVFEDGLVEIFKGKLLYDIEKYPQFATQEYSNGQYLIHKAIGKKLSFEVIKKIVSAYKDGLTKEFNDDLPLHIAMNKNYDCKAILYLIEKYPQSMTVRNKLGHYPIELLMANKYPTYIVVECIDAFRESMKLLSWSSIVFHQIYKDMLARYVDQYSRIHLGLTNYVCKQLSAMINENINDEVNDQILRSLRNRDQSTDGIDKQSDDSFCIERKTDDLNENIDKQSDESSSILRKIDDINEKIDALSIVLNSMNDQMSNIDNNVQELTERINMVENNIDEIRNERDTFFACDDSIKNHLTQMTEFVNLLKSTVIQKEEEEEKEEKEVVDFGGGMDMFGGGGGDDY